MKRISVAGVLIALAAMVAACGGRAAPETQTLPEGETAVVQQAPDASDPDAPVDIGDATNCYRDPDAMGNYACFSTDHLALADRRAEFFRCATTTKVTWPVTLIVSRTTDANNEWGPLVVSGDEAMVACLSDVVADAPTATTTPGTSLKTVIRLRRND